MRVKNYINNKDLYQAMIQHRSKLQESIDNNQSKPQISDYIGKSILLICNNLVKRPNFSGYTYKEEFVSDALIDCIAAVDNFDPNKTDNPFAYFTQIAWNACIRRIHKEKKQTYIKHKNFQNYYLLEDVWQDLHVRPGSSPGGNEYSDELIRSFENNLTKNKKPATLVGVEKFIEKEKTNE